LIEDDRVLREAELRRRKTKCYRRPLPTLHVRHGYVECVRHSHELRERSGLHFPHDVRAMDLIRNLANAKMRRGLLVEPATDHERQNLALARR
jgi:hypothetical protein